MFSLANAASASNQSACPKEYPPHELVDYFIQAAFSEDQDHLEIYREAWSRNRGNNGVFQAIDMPKGEYIRHALLLAIQSANTTLGNNYSHLHIPNSRQSENRIYYTTYSFRAEDKKVMKTDPRVAWVVSQIPTLMRDKSSAYLCQINVKRNSGSDSDLTRISSYHQLPSEGFETADDASAAWACVGKSYLSYLGYQNISTVQSDKLVTTFRRNGNQLVKMSPLYNWLLSTAINNNVHLNNGLTKKQVSKALNQFLNRECK